jgi:hypothetical protein
MCELQRTASLAAQPCLLPLALLPAAGREVAGGTNQVALVQELFSSAAQELSAVIGAKSQWAPRPSSILDCILNVHEAVTRQSGQRKGQAAAGQKRGWGT